MTSYRPDVLIVGSGPVGTALAHQLVMKEGLDVLMIDAGDQESTRYGENLRNAGRYRKEVDPFVNVIKGALSPVSTFPPPPSFSPFGGGSVTGPGHNPEQNAPTNLRGAAVTRAVGGMGTIWACGVPQFVPEVELTWKGQKYPIDAATLESQYQKAGDLLGRSLDAFQGSVRHQAAKKTLLAAGHNTVTELPLAARVTADGRIVWAGSDTLLGPLSDPAYKPEAGSFTLLPQHLCTKLRVETDGERWRVAGVEVSNLADQGEEVDIVAKAYVVAGGAVLTPQLLSASGLEEHLPALGRYLTDSPVAFCQVVLKKEIIDGLPKLVTEDALTRIQAHQKQHPQDPLPIPFDDAPPNLFIPPTEDRPWHAQIQRAAFSHGEVGPQVDDRVVLDLRWYGICRPREENRVSFSSTVKDVYGMPHPTFDFTPSKEDDANAQAMMNHMTEVANALGGYLPGSYPQFLDPGTGQQTAGTTRMGTDRQTSVVDSDSRVWAFDNLYLGGNGLHPFGNASSPTLTSIATALHATDAINATVKNA
ncbi:pyranose oxidase [Streptomyces antnestii]|uniref:Pyranose oxidase n=1 Tax=Streptomyces antnestii TaxID=2494256 RepID=A0A3S2V5W4_9ACTN|nr:GMC oxidoreductase [Streptomyces sp. San01]RVU16287.1 pyranose oxidase [Streptomyces sp. San01]